MKEINCPNCNQHIKILGTDYDLYLENLKKEEREIERLKAIVEGTKENRNELQEEIKRLKEEYVILQNASDEVEEEKDKEIERLNNDIKELLKENGNKEKVIKKQDNIIKEVRECINHYAIENEDYSKIYNDEEKELLEILDKVDKDV